MMKFIALCLVLVVGVLHDASAQTGVKRAVIVLTNRSEIMSKGQQTGYNLTQLVRIVDGLGRADFGFAFASPNGGATVADPNTVDTTDSLARAFLANEAVQKALLNTLPARNIDPSKFGVIVFVGGHGALWDFVETRAPADAAMAIHSRGGIVAAIAQGSAALLLMNTPSGGSFLRDLRVTSSTEAEEQELDVLQDIPVKLDQSLRYNGAIFFASGPREWNVVVDDRVITAQNTESADGLARAIVEKWNLMHPASEEKEYKVQAPPKKKKERR